MSMLRPQCPYCERVNPSGSKFCNACGAPLHLVPCRHCGAVNDAGATKCYQCGTALGAREGSAFTAPSSVSHPVVAAGAAAAAVAKGAPEADTLERDAKLLATLHELQQRLTQIEVGAAGRDPDRGKLEAQGADPPPELAVVARPDDAIRHPTPAVYGPAASRPGRRMARPRSKGMLIGTAALAGVAMAAYFAFDQRQAADATRAPAAAGRVVAGESAAEAVLPPGADTTNAQPPGDTPKEVPTPAVRPGVAPGAQPVARPGPGNIAPPRQESASRPAVVPQREGPVASAAPAAAASAPPRPPETRAGIERPPPPRIGPCTEAVAALGLCTPESTQRRE